MFAKSFMFNNQRTFREHPEITFSWLNGNVEHIFVSWEILGEKYCLIVSLADALNAVYIDSPQAFELRPQNPSTVHRKWLIVELNPMRGCGRY